MSTNTMPQFYNRREPTAYTNSQVGKVLSPYSGGGGRYLCRRVGGAAEGQDLKRQFKPPSLRKAAGRRQSMHDVRNYNRTKPL